jgi:flagellin
MSLGVLNNINAIYAESNLNKTSSSLSTVLNQLSSGSKINSGADDAAGLSLVNGLQANASALTQSQTNATEGSGLLTVADGALSQVTSLLDRAVTLATEASNGTLNSTQDTAANNEYKSILSEISNIGATTTYNGQNVFGSKTDIYTGDSTAAGASINSLNIASLSSSSVGDTNGTMSYSSGSSNVFIDLSNGGTNAALTDSLNSTGTTSLTVGYLTSGTGGTAVQATATITVGSGTSYDNTVSGLLSAINSSGLGLTASLGTAASAGTAAATTATDANLENSALKTNSTDTGIIISGTGISVNSTGTNGVGEVGKITVADSTTDTNANAATLAGTLSIVGSDGTTHSVKLGTANSTDTLANLATTINSANYGVTATYTQAAGTAAASLVFTSNDSSVTVSQTSASITATDASDTITASLSGTPTAAGTASSTAIDKITLGNVGDTASTTLLGTLVIGSNTIALGNGSSTNDLTSLAATINKGSYGVTATIDTTGTSAALVLSSENSVTPTVTSSAMKTGTYVAVTTQPNTTSSSYYSKGISTTGITDSSTGGGTAVVGMSSNSNGTGTATISYSDGAGQSLSNTDLSNQKDAEAALTALNSAITDVAAQDGYIGAQINQLNSVSSVLSTQSENVTSAQNAVQATDYASATSNMSKYEILSQTGIAALAQANSVQQEVTKLLQ